MKEIILFGTGVYLQQAVLKMDPGVEIAALCDNDPSKWGTEPLNNGWNCISPEELYQKRASAVVYIAALHPQTLSDIERQLQEHQMEYYHIDCLLEQYRETYETRQLKRYEEEFSNTGKQVPGKLHRFIACYLPEENCNLRCSYCYIQQNGSFRSREPFLYSPQFIRRALGSTRLGGTAFINICGGGETLLYSELPALVAELLKEGHYVQLVTNGTVTKAVRELLRLSKEEAGHLFFKFSLHYKELCTKGGLLERFAENVRLVNQSPASFTIEMVPSDEMEAQIEEIKRFSMEQFGAMPHLTVPRDETTKEFRLLSKRTKEEFCAVWQSFDSALFAFKMGNVNVRRSENCQAGRLSYVLNLGTGELQQCNGNRSIGNIYQDITLPFPEEPVNSHCMLPYCFNCHAYLTLGVIPEVTAPTYYEVRDRERADGSHWIKEEMRRFFIQRLDESLKR